MSSSTEAQRLIALSLGKIAMSRQQRGGINLHKNLLVASVLHKARTTYMMDNFQTLLANKRAQAEREAAAKMIVDTPCEKKSSEKSTMDTSYQSRGVNDCNKASDSGAPNGERPETRNCEMSDKENVIPSKENRLENTENTSFVKSDTNDKKSSQREITNNTPVVTGKLPLSRNNGNTNYVSQLSSCRCAGSKRRRSFVDCDSVTEPKKPRFEDYENCDSDSDYESDSGDNFEQMQTTESTQVKSLVDIFSSGFHGLCKDNESTQQQSSGHINVYVSADRSLSGHQYVLKDISCGTQIKDNVSSMHTAIALAV